MKLTKALAVTAAILCSYAAHAQDNEVALGKSAYGALCAICHGDDGKGSGDIAELFKVPPSDLTALAKMADGQFPFVQVYNVLAEGMQERGHGEAEMPIWGDYFVSDSLEDRGMLPGDAVAIAAGRIMAVTLYLESIQE